MQFVKLYPWFVNINVRVGVRAFDTTCTKKSPAVIDLLLLILNVNRRFRIDHLLPMIKKATRSGKR